jgi:plasmid maintenance system killer protein
MIDAAKSLEDLRTPPSNHLEAPKGKRLGQHSIRISIYGVSASLGWKVMLGM